MLLLLLLILMLLLLLLMLLLMLLLLLLMLLLLLLLLLVPSLYKNPLIWYACDSRYHYEQDLHRGGEATRVLQRVPGGRGVREAETEAGERRGVRCVRGRVLGSYTGVPHVLDIGAEVLRVRCGGRGGDGVEGNKAMSLVWSHYQEDIFTAGVDTQDSLIIEAVAGSGKTTVLEELLYRIWQARPWEKVVFVAFGKPIAVTMNARLKARGMPELASTLHSVGFRAWKRSLGWDSNLCKAEMGKTWAVMKGVMSWEEREKWGASTAKMVGLGKQVGIVPRNMYLDTQLGSVVEPYMEHALVLDTDEAWEALADQYSVEWEDCNIELIRKVLARGIELSREAVDFDDMLYMPVVSGVEFDKWDVVFVDESQDLSSIQIEMVSRMVKGRVISVGDRNQSCYGFRGAHTESMDELKKRFSCRELPLSISYRCPRAVVEWAKQWVPQVEAAEGAADGYVGELGTDWRGQASLASAAGIEFSQQPTTAKGGASCAEAGESPAAASAGGGDLSREGISKWKELKDFSPGDAILCRLTRPLVAVAFELVRNRIACRVLGRDIGAGLVALVRRVCKVARIREETGLGAFCEALAEYSAAQKLKLIQKKKWAEAGRLDDQIQTVLVFMDSREVRGDGNTGLTSGSDTRRGVVAEATVADLIAEIEALFEDNGGTRRGVTLSTIHKFKGLEADRVFVLSGESCEWRWARQDWEHVQEGNLRYVACTRAKRELRYVTLRDLGLEDD